MVARHGAPFAKPTTHVTLSMRISVFDLTKSSLACAARRNVAASASVVTHRRPRFSQRAPGQTSRRRLTSSGFHAKRTVAISDHTPGSSAQNRTTPTDSSATECCDRQRFIGLLYAELISLSVSPRCDDTGPLGWRLVSRGNGYLLCRRNVRRGSEAGENVRQKSVYSPLA